MGAWKINNTSPSETRDARPGLRKKAPHLGQVTETGAFSVTPGQVNLAIAHARLHKESAVAALSCAFLTNFDSVEGEIPLQLLLTTLLQSLPEDS